MIGSWPHSHAGETSDEYAVIFDSGRKNRLLILPALFDEGNKMRHFTIEVMRRIDKQGWDSIIPDLPAQNESLSPPTSQSISSWREAAAQCAIWFKASHVLTIRASAVLAPAGLPGWRYAATKPASQLNGMLRGRVIASRELGIQESRDDLRELGQTEGLELGGYQLGAKMVGEMAASARSETAAETDHEAIAQGALGGGGLWLRAEPDHAPDQADRLANIISGNSA